MRKPQTLSGIFYLSKIYNDPHKISNKSIRNLLPWYIIYGIITIIIGPGFKFPDNHPKMPLKNDLYIFLYCIILL